MSEKEYQVKKNKNTWFLCLQVLKLEILCLVKSVVNSRMEIIWFLGFYSPLYRTNIHSQSPYFHLPFILQQK